jgi:hypothetical protein
MRCSYEEAIALSSHKHDLKTTHVCFIEYDDVNLDRLGVDRNYFGEGNSKERKMEFTFEYCVDCSLRLLDGKPIKTQDILEHEFERYVIKAKNKKYVASEETTVQHTDFETLQRLIKAALEFGKLKKN